MEAAFTEYDVVMLQLGKLHPKLGPNPSAFLS